MATSEWLHTDNVDFRVLAGPRDGVVRLQLVWGISEWDEQIAIDLTGDEARALAMRLWPAADRDQHGGMSVDLTGGSEG